jgi:hypothetical protein
VHHCDRNTIAMIMTLSAPNPARHFALAGVVLAAMLACWSGNAFGETLDEFTLRRGVTAPTKKSLLPPPEYDRPYAGVLTVMVYDTVREVQEVCGGPAVACAVPMGGRCHIHIPRDYLIEDLYSTYDKVMRHEIAHCNGWRHEEPKWNEKWSWR